jgi:hypothetical protein
MTEFSLGAPRDDELIDAFDALEDVLQLDTIGEIDLPPYLTRLLLQLEETLSLAPTQPPVSVCVATGRRHLGAGGPAARRRGQTETRLLLLDDVRSLSSRRGVPRAGSAAEAEPRHLCARAGRRGEATRPRRALPGRRGVDAGDRGGPPGRATGGLAARHSSPAAGAAAAHRTSRAETPVRGSSRGAR